MFRQDLKNNLKNKIMRNRRRISDIFDLIKVAINLDNKLYKRVIKKKYNQSQKRARIFFKSVIEY